MKFDNHKFRCSQLGLVMTGSFGITEIQQKKIAQMDAKMDSGKELTEIQQKDYDMLLYKHNNPELSETTKTLLKEIYIQETYSRNKEITSKYLEKGIQVEEDSLKLLSDYEGTDHLKNKDFFENDFIRGTPDYNGDKIKDTKSSWSIWTFFNSKPTPEYNAQLQGYMWLCNKEQAELVYCLVDTPQHLIVDEQKKHYWRTGYLSEEDPQFLADCEEIEKNMLYPDIPKEKRLRIFDVSFDEGWIAELQQRIIACRFYLNNICEDVRQ